MTRPPGPPRPGSNRPNRATTIAKLLGVLVVFSILATGLVLPYVGGAGLVAKHESDKFLNSTCDLQETAPPQGTTFYASDGTTAIATIFTQNRKPVPLTQMPKFLQQALVDTEDRRFYEHHGVDMRGLIRSAFSTSGGDTQGGSTLTMQYVKQVRYYQAIGNAAAQEAAISQNLDRKIQDAKCAIDLEQRESKSEILENYLNIAFFGENSYSVEAAAETYFNKTTANLTLPEAATLVGILRAPSDYDPFQHPQAAKDRRNQVIENMVTSGDLTKAQAATYEATPMKLYTDQPPAVTSDCYNAPTTVANVGFFCDYVRHWLINTQKLTSDQISEGGYKVITTLNVGIQNAAQASVSAALPASSPETALLPVTDPKTGNILAMVSSKPFGVQAGQLASSNVFYGYVSDAASTYKYFTMIAALRAGITPSFALGNNSTDHKTYNPKNCASGSVQNLAGGINYTPTETLQSAIAKSSNTYFVGIEDQLFYQCDLSPIVNTATSLGLNGINQTDPGADGTGTKTYAQNIESQKQWSLTLGEIPTSPLELTGAYAAAANDGTYCTPAPVLSITDQSGQPVAIKRTPCTVQMTPQVARTALSLLNGDTKSGGTSAKVFASWYSKNSSLIAGKTGTSTATVGGKELNTGFWFSGVTPQLSATMAIVNVGQPAAPVTGLPGITDTVAQNTADGSVASQYWLNALSPVLGGAKWTLPASTAIAGSIAVPPVTNQSQAAATTALTAAGFKVEVFPVTCGSTALFGQVAYYSPQTAVPGTTVSICMSNATAPYTIPVPKPTVTATPTKPTAGTTPGAPVVPGAPGVPTVSVSRPGG